MKIGPIVIIVAVQAEVPHGVTAGAASKILQPQRVDPVKNHSSEQVRVGDDVAQRQRNLGMISFHKLFCNQLYMMHTWWDIFS